MFEQKVLSNISQVEGLEEQCRQFRVDCDSAQRDLKDVAAQLQDEQKRAIGLSQELAKNVSSRQSLMEAEEKARDLQKENSILRESNNKLLDSAYDLERERQFHATENALKLQGPNSIHLKMSCMLSHKWWRFERYSVRH